MEVQKFCLTWKDFNTVFNREFNELRESGDFFDVTLACEDGQISAHKLVLSAASDFFKEILRKANHEHPLIYLNGVRAAEVGSILEFIYTGETEVAEDCLEVLLATGGNLRIKGLTESTEEEETGKKQERSKTGSKPWDHPVEITGIKAEVALSEEYPLVTEDYVHQSELESPGGQNEPINVSSFLSPNSNSARQVWPALVGQPRKLGHQRALVQSNNQNETELNRRVSELMVSSYDPVLGKTIWQCAQCHYSSKLRYTVKEHVETHISGFCHQCPLCAKTCKTRNALRVHTIRKHSTKTAPHAVVKAGDQIEIRHEQAGALKSPRKERKPKLQEMKALKGPKPGELLLPEAHMGHLGQGLLNHPMMGFMGPAMLGHPMMGQPPMPR